MKRIFLAFLFSLLVPVCASAQTAGVQLSWTAPGDDGNVGTATSYQVRWSTTKPDTTSQTTITAWWNSATDASIYLPTPLVAGTTQGAYVLKTGGSFQPGTYYFVMKACDEVPNCSLYSNVAVAIVPDLVAPARITDLRATPQ